MGNTIIILGNAENLVGSNKLERIIERMSKLVTFSGANVSMKSLQIDDPKRSDIYYIVDIDAYEKRGELPRGATLIEVSIIEVWIFDEELGKYIKDGEYPPTVIGEYEANTDEEP